jgi:hypothetical protein
MSFRKIPGKIGRINLTSYESVFTDPNIQTKRALGAPPPPTLPLGWSSPLLFLNPKVRWKRWQGLVLKAPTSLWHFLRAGPAIVSHLNVNLPKERNPVIPARRKGGEQGKYVFILFSVYNCSPGIVLYLSPQVALSIQGPLSPVKVGRGPERAPYRIYLKNIFFIPVHTLAFESVTVLLF